MIEPLSSPETHFSSLARSLNPKKSHVEVLNFTTRSARGEMYCNDKLM